MSGNSRQRRKAARSFVIPRVKAITTDSICGNGTYWCMHVFEDERPWVWVDFRFPSLKHPKRLYYACAMRTLEYARINEIEDSVYDKSTTFDSTLDLLPLIKRMSDPEFIAKTQDDKDKINAIVANDVAFMRPSIALKDYGDGAIGVHCTVNTPYINDAVIRKFIEHFRLLGEPTLDGYTWHGEEVKVEPKYLSNEYGKRPL